MDVHALNMNGKAWQEIAVGAKLVECLLKRTKRSAGLHMRFRRSAWRSRFTHRARNGRFKTGQRQRNFCAESNSQTSMCRKGASTKVFDVHSSADVRISANGGRVASRDKLA